MLLNLKSQPSHDGWVHKLTIILMSTMLLATPGAKLIGENPSQVFINEEGPDNFHIVQNNTIKSLPSPSPINRNYTLGVIVTGYSSTPEQTDSTPFITASGKRVRDGIVATNLLAFGTKIKIPSIYGDRVFVVEDRMHTRNSVNVDIWFPTYGQAKAFGVKRAYIEVLD